MQRLFAITTFFFAATVISAQPGCTFLKSAYNLGQVVNLDYPPVSFTFVNTGNEPLAILVVNKKEEIKVRYEQKFVPPGDSGELLVFPNLNKTGPFSEEISILTNASDEVQILKISGTVIDIQECFPGKEKPNIREIIVINRITREPVANAGVELNDNFVNRIFSRTNSSGKASASIRPGLYHVGITASGYREYSDMIYLKRSVPVLFFEIDPEEKISDPIETVQKDSVETPPVFPENSDLLPIDKYAVNNLVFLVDVSLSMKEENKLEHLKQSVKELIKILRPVDNVSLISYADDPEILLKSVGGMEKEKMNPVIDQLRPHGITNGVKGLSGAYELAEDKFSSTGNNQVILATDGEFSDNKTNPEKLRKMIEEYAEKGITLSIIGFGTEEKAVSFMKDIAAAGKGKYIQVSEKDDVTELLINEIKENSLIAD